MPVVVVFLGLLSLVGLLVPSLGWGLTLVSGGGGTVRIQDEGGASTTVGTLNCTGAGIACTTVSGVTTISVSGLGTSGLADPGSNGLVHRTSLGVTAAYAGTSCTNQVVRALSAPGVATCVTLTSAYVDSSIALTGGHLGQFAATTSAQLAAVLSDEEGGSGGFVRAGGTVALATALTANGANCGAGQFPLGVDASGTAETCTALPTTITGTANQITASAATGAITLSIPTNPTLPGTTTGTFSGNVTGNLTGNVTGNATTATALAADPSNCDPGSVASGVNAAGVPDCVLLPISEGDSITWGAGLAYSSPTASIASTEAGFLTNGGSTDLVGGGGGQGKMQVMETGRLQYTGGETVSVVYSGFLLPSPLSWNITAATCTGDANGGKLTVNGSNQVVCATDSVGEGGGGPGDMTAVGNLASGDAGTAGFPLTNVWWLESTAPASPASTQGLVWLDSTSKNFAIKTSDGAVKHLVQTVAPAANQFVTGIASDGAVSLARPSSADLSDGSALARLAGPQTLTGTQVVPRVCELSASSGSLTPNADLCDVVYRHDVAGSVAMQDPTATGDNPRNMQSLTVSFYAASAQAVTWTSGYAGGYGLALPETIPAGKYTAVAFRRNSTSAKWELWSAHDPTIYVNSVLFQGVTDGVITMQPQASAGTYNFNLPTTAGASGAVLTSAGGVGAAMTWTATASANTASALVQRDGSGNFTAGTITASLTGNASTATALQADLPYSALTAASAISKLLGRGSAAGAGDWEEITLGTNLTMSGTTLNAAGAAAGNGHKEFAVGGYAIPPTGTVSAQLDTSQNVLRLLFDNTTQWCGRWQFLMPADYAAAGAVSAELMYHPVGTVGSGTVHFDVKLYAISSGDAAAVTTDSFATANDCNDATIPTTAGFPEKISCALTNLDSLVALDLTVLEVCRDVANDNAATQVALTALQLYYAR